MRPNNSKSKACVSVRGFPLRGGVKKATRTKLAELVTHHALRFLKQRTAPPQYVGLLETEADLKLHDSVQEVGKKIEDENARKEKTLRSIVQLRIWDNESHGGMGFDAINGMNVVCNLMGSELYVDQFCPYMTALLKEEEKEFPALFREMWTKDIISESFAEGGTDISYFGQIASIINDGNIELAERSKRNSTLFLDPKTGVGFPIPGL